MNIINFVESLDKRTLLFLSAVVIIAATIISVFRAFFNRERSAIIYTGGFILGLAGILTNPSWSGLHVDILINGFYFFLVWGQRSNNGADRAWPRRFWSYLGAWLSLQLIFIFIVDSIQLRLILNSCILAALSVEYLAALEGRRHRLPSTILWLARAVILSQVLVNVTMIVCIALADDPVSARLYDSFLQNCSLIILTFYLVLWAQVIMGIEVAELIEELKLNNHTLEKIAVTDTLTCLFNRYHFNKRANDEIARAKRYGESLSLIMYDLDHFKRVNDTWGHPTGDTVLKHTAAIVAEQIRDPDTLFRWGGEEFLILAPHTSLGGAVHLAEKVRNAISAATFPDVGKVTASFGVAEWEQGQSSEVWLHHADQALYCAKNGGRDRVASFVSSAGSSRA
jgi:diguanylate cyclase (GGDEF)-like protein